MSQNAHDTLTELVQQRQSGTISEQEYVDRTWTLLTAEFNQRKLVEPVFPADCKREITDARNSVFCYIPASPFVFGETGEYAALRFGIYMAKFPVTVGQFDEFLQASSYAYDEADKTELNAISPSRTCPATNVSWLDAKEYCRWLRKETGDYYSLPSELEWEIAARGLDGRPYPWGHNPVDPTLAWYQGDQPNKGTVAVGKFPGNCSPYGCMDMVGNVWEWCLDDIDDPREPHILRGGSWCNTREFCGCVAKTMSYPPDKRVNYAGFRLLYLPAAMLEAYRAAMTAEECFPSNLPIADATPSPDGDHLPLGARVEELAPEVEEEEQGEKKSLKKLGAAPPARRPVPSGRPPPSRRPAVGGAAAAAGGMDKSALEKLGVKFRKADDPPPPQSVPVGKTAVADTGKQTPAEIGTTKVVGDDKSSADDVVQLVDLQQETGIAAVEKSALQKAQAATEVNIPAWATNGAVAVWGFLLFVVVCLWIYKMTTL